MSDHEVTAVTLQFSTNSGILGSKLKASVPVAQYCTQALGKSHFLMSEDDTEAVDMDHGARTGMHHCALTVL